MQTRKAEPLSGFPEQWIATRKTIPFNDGWECVGDITLAVHVTEEKVWHRVEVITRGYYGTKFYDFPTQTEAETRLSEIVEQYAKRGAIK